VGATSRAVGWDKGRLEALSGVSPLYVGNHALNGYLAMTGMRLAGRRGSDQQSIARRRTKRLAITFRLCKPTWSPVPASKSEATPSLRFLRTSTA
jgi:hypothetical protein